MFFLSGAGQLLKFFLPLNWLAIVWITSTGWEEEFVRHIVCAIDLIFGYVLWRVALNISISSSEFVNFFMAIKCVHYAHDSFCFHFVASLFNMICESLLSSCINEVCPVFFEPCFNTLRIGYWNCLNLLNQFLCCVGLENYKKRKIAFS